MTNVRNVFLRLVMLLLVVGMGAGRVFGDDLIKGEIVSVGIGGVNGKGGVYRAGSWVPVRVRMENRSGALLEGRLAVEQNDLDGDKVLSLGPDVLLQGGDVEGRDFWLYYWPRPDDELHGIKNVLFLDKSASAVRATIPAAAAYDSLGLGLKDDGDGRSMRWVVVLGPDSMGLNNFNGAYGGTEAVRVVTASSAAGFPDNVLGLDGVDTIVWEADKVRPSDLPADFQLKALLDWVQAGGHLIVSVGTQGQEFLKNGDRLSGALPMTFTAPRQTTLDEMRNFPGLSDLHGTQTVTQVVGTVKEGARVISPGLGTLEGHPLAVTGLYGRGAVTVVTVDMAHPLFTQNMSELGWLDFWNGAGGWQAVKMLTRNGFDDAEKKRAAANDNTPTVYPTPHFVELGAKFSDLVDVTEVTQIRLLVAVLFLAVYWLAAGPIGHVILKIYKVVHWSWWIFGGTVVVAGGVAGAVVIFLQLTNYDLRHKTFVLGAVNSKDVTTLGFYGVFAPKSGLVQVSQPSGTGMNYLAPMNLFSVDPVKPFADPDSYVLFDEKADEVTPVFRNTLKKMQGRWTGTMEGITGVGTLSGNAAAPLSGSLVNNTGYDLSQVEIILEVRTAGQVSAISPYNVYDVGTWKAGTTLDLSKALTLVKLGGSKGTLVERLADLLRLLAHQHQESAHSYSMPGVPGLGHDMSADEKALVDGRPVDLLYSLWDGRATDVLQDDTRVEAERSLARAADATKMLYATGGLIVAKAGDVGTKTYVKSPVVITVNGRVVEGRGEVNFAWAFPVSGKPLTQSTFLPNAPAADDKDKAGANP